MNEKSVNDAIPFSDFLDILKQEYDYHKNGGTEYRKETARLSLEIAMKVKSVVPFLDHMSAKRLVFEYLPLANNQRKDDVAKMLRVLAKKLYLEKNTPNEVKEYVNKKIKNGMVLRKL